MRNFTPFADDAASLGIGEMTVENGSDTISIYGTLNIKRDQSGLTHARMLKAVLDQVVSDLEALSDLPEALAAPEKPAVVKNPFD